MNEFKQITVEIITEMKLVELKPKLDASGYEFVKYEYSKVWWEISKLITNMGIVELIKEKIYT